MNLFLLFSLVASLHAVDSVDELLGFAGKDRMDLSLEMRPDIYNPEFNRAHLEDRIKRNIPGLIRYLERLNPASLVLEWSEVSEDGAFLDYKYPLVPSEIGGLVKTLLEGIDKITGPGPGDNPSLYKFLVAESLHQFLMVLIPDRHMGLVLTKGSPEVGGVQAAGLGAKVMWEGLGLREDLAKETRVYGGEDKDTKAFCDKLSDLDQEYAGPHCVFGEKCKIYGGRCLPKSEYNCMSLLITRAAEKGYHPTKDQHRLFPFDRKSPREVRGKLLACYRRHGADLCCGTAQRFSHPHLTHRLFSSRVFAELAPDFCNAVAGLAQVGLDEISHVSFP